MKAIQIIFDVSRDLNDQVIGAEYVRWTEPQLLSYYQEALIALAEASKQDFTEEVVLPVAHGTGWQKACDCTEIMRIVGESDADGTVISYMTQRKDNDVFVWPGSTATTCLMTRLKHPEVFNSYIINKNKSEMFRVYPPALPGQSRYVLAECYMEPDTSNMDFDVPNKFVAAIKQWMLYRALIVDAENNAAIAEVAKTHLSTYASLYKALADASKEQEDQHGANSSVRATQNTPAR